MNGKFFFFLINLRSQTIINLWALWISTRRGSVFVCSPRNSWPRFNLNGTVCFRNTAAGTPRPYIIFSFDCRRNICVRHRHGRLGNLRWFYRSKKKKNFLTSKISEHTGLSRSSWIVCLSRMYSLHFRKLSKRFYYVQFSTLLRLAFRLANSYSNTMAYGQFSSIRIRILNTYLRIMVFSTAVGMIVTVYWLEWNKNTLKVIRFVPEIHWSVRYFRMFTGYRRCYKKKYYKLLE